MIHLFHLFLVHYHLVHFHVVRPASACYVGPGGQPAGYCLS